MNAAIIGYGKMGREIESILLERGHRVVLIIDQDNAQDLTIDNLKRCAVDAAIEFSTPDRAFDNISVCLNAGLPVVSGTTGWLDRVEEIRELCRKNEGAFFYAPNYSIGVNIVFEVNKMLAGLMDQFSQYDVTIEETHHIHKKDAPSGTAVALADGILEGLGRKTEWTLRTDPQPEMLQIAALRRGTVPGTHTVAYDSAEDSITITHTAKGRRGFAAGAVLAAEFILGRKGFFTMQDLLGLNNNSNQWEK